MQPYKIKPDLCTLSIQNFLLWPRIQSDRYPELWHVLYARHVSSAASAQLAKLRKNVQSCSICCNVSCTPELPTPIPLNPLL